MTASEEVEETEAKDRGGRPPKEINPDQLRKLRGLQMTDEEIASVFNVSTRTLYRRIKVEPWKGAWDDGRHEGHASLRRLQWQHAQMPNSAGVQMAIHLSKHWLGEHDKSLNLNVSVSDLDKAIAELERRVEADRGQPAGDAGGDRQAPALPTAPSSSSAH